jgi:arylsulfatase A-like enzyme
LEPILPTLGDRAIAFLREATAAAEPFLLYLPLTTPHTPLAVNPEWKGKSGLNDFADLVMETDATIGRVLRALEDTGQAGNTLVLFTSDNGCAPYIDVAGLEKMGHYPSGPLRGYKADVWEGGHRVPFIIRWPGRVKPGSSCQQLVHQADLLATLAEILETPLPDNAGEDSFSLLPLLRGEDRPIRETAVSCSIQGVPGVRLGSWKYIPAEGSAGWGKGGDTSQPLQLYDLAVDLSEQRNLAGADPTRLAQMQQVLEKLIVDGRSRPGPAQANDVEVVRYPRSPVQRKAKSR